MTTIKNAFVSYFQQQQHVIDQNLEVSGIVLDRYSLNFGDSRLFPQNGYCILLSYLIMDIIYSNIVIYGSIDLLSPDKMRIYFENVQRYLFDIKRRNTTLFYNICMNYSFKVFEQLDINDDQSPLDPRFFSVHSVEDIKRESLLSPPYSFKAGICKLILFTNSLPTLVGINYINDKDPFTVSQANNDFHYFIPDYIDPENETKNQIINRTHFEFSDVRKYLHMIAFANNYKNCLYLQPKSPTQTDITDSIPNFCFLFYNIRRVVEEFQAPVINLSFDEQLHKEQVQNGNVSDGYDSYNANNTSESDGYDTSPRLNEKLAP